MAISFHAIYPKFHLTEKRKLKSWINLCIESRSFETGDINFIFCTDDYLLEINKTHLNHDDLTDIITFDLSFDAQTITGDIFISIDRVKENAQTFNVLFEEELRRVMIHGVLHLTGENDKSPDEQNRMRKAENQALEVWSKL